MRYPVCLVILALMLAVTSCSHDTTRIPQNEGIIAFEEFCVSSESTELETYTRGTIFVRENKGNNEYHVQIVAWVEVDPKDWGGVEFAIPFGWEVIGITSSYTSGSEYKDNPADNISVLSSTSNPSESFKFPRLVRVEGGGRGNLLIEIDSTSSEKNPWPGVLKVRVGVGSDERDGVRIQYPDWQEIEIPLN